MSLAYTYTNNTNLISTIPRRQYINNGETNSIMGMPQKFGVSDGQASFSSGRRLYIEAYLNGRDKTNGITSKLPRQGKPITAQSSGQHIQQKKNNAIGRATTNKSGNTISFANNDRNLVNSRIARCRSSGCVAPSKIAISNSNTSRCY
jgi:hypothetical protein